MQATFRSRRTGTVLGTFDGSLLIGADGIHSAVRGRLYPDEGAPVWKGVILWRGISRAAPFLGGRTMVMVGHQHQKFVAYPISREAEAGDAAVVNWIAERKFPPEYVWRREDWNRAGRLADFLPQFENWRFDWLDIPRLIGAADHCFEYPMVDRDPLPRWTFGPATLLGDAAHPMYPIGSNGASQAILDARVLARAIRAHGPTEAALGDYEAERRPATTAIVLANRQQGPDQVMELVEQRAPGGFAQVEDVLPASELEVIAASYKRLAGFDKDALNGRPPILQRDRVALAGRRRGRWSGW